VQGGGGVMVWAAFHGAAKIPLIMIKTTMNWKGYVRMLNQNLLPFLPDDFIFQQDNAPLSLIHI